MLDNMPPTKGQAKHVFQAHRSNRKAPIWKPTHTGRKHTVNNLQGSTIERLRVKQ